VCGVCGKPSAEMSQLVSTLFAWHGGRIDAAADAAPRQHLQHIKGALFPIWWQLSKRVSICTRSSC
jgi:hypothetical protein